MGNNCSSGNSSSSSCIPTYYPVPAACCCSTDITLLLLLLLQIASLTPLIVNFVWAAYVSTSFQPVRLDPLEGPVDMVGRTNLLSMSIPCQDVPNNPITPGFVVRAAPDMCWQCSSMCCYKQQGIHHASSTQ
jgi:hypothetical protein